MNIGSAVFAVFLSASPVAAAASDDGRVTGSFDAGFDSFQEKYTIVDEDTLDSISEFRSRVALGYSGGSYLRDFFHVQSRALFGNDSFEYTGRLDLIKRLGSGSSRVAISADVTRRDYRDDSSYDFANNYTRYYLRSYMKWKPSPSTSIRISDRIEHLDYDDRTEFDYDYTRNSIKVQTEFDWNLTNLLNVGVRFTSMDIPDSTEIQYESWTPELELRLAPGLYRNVSLYASAERRLYAHEPVRSSFWALLLNATVEWPVAGAFGVELHNETESYTYDAGTGVYFDYTETRNSALVKYNHGWDLRVGAGPAFSYFVSDDSPDDEYDEYGLKFTLDYLRGRRLWLASAYESGSRRYDAYGGSAVDPLDESLFSNYTYHRINLLASLQVWDDVNLNTFLDYQPEDHERESDDATATLFSISLTYVF